MSAADFLFHLVFFVLVFGVPIFLALATASSEGWAAKINVGALWTHNGRLDKFAVILLGSWWVHSCAMILWILTKSISDVTVAQYMGWGIPIIARMFAPARTQDDAPPAPPKG